MFEFFKSSNPKLGELGCPQLKDIGLTSAEKKMLKSAFNVAKVSEIPEEKAVVQVLLNRLGRSPEEIKKIQTLGDGAVAAELNNDFTDFKVDKLGAWTVITAKRK